MLEKKRVSYVIRVGIEFLSLQNTRGLENSSSSSSLSSLRNRRSIAENEKSWSGFATVFGSHVEKCSPYRTAIFSLLLLRATNFVIRICLSSFYSMPLLMATFFVHWIRSLECSPCFLSLTLSSSCIETKRPFLYIRWCANCITRLWFEAFWFGNRMIMFLLFLEGGTKSCIIEKRRRSVRFNSSWEKSMNEIYCYAILVLDSSCLIYLFL